MESGVRQLVLLTAGFWASWYCSTGYSLRGFLNASCRWRHLSSYYERWFSSRNTPRDSICVNRTQFDYRVYYFLDRTCSRIMSVLFAAVLLSCRFLSLSRNGTWKFSLIRKDEAYEKYCAGEVSTSCSPSNISTLSNIAHIPQIRARISLRWKYSP